MIFPIIFSMIIGIDIKNKKGEGNESKGIKWWIHKNKKNNRGC